MDRLQSESIRQSSQEDDLESVRLSQADELSPPSSPEPITPFQNKRRKRSSASDHQSEGEKSSPSEEDNEASVTPNVQPHQSPYVTSNARRKDLMYSNRYSPQTPAKKKKALEKKLKHDFPDEYRELQRREDERKKKREFCPDSHGSIAGLQFTNPGLLMLGQSALHRSGAISSLSTIDPAFLALHSPEKRIEILNSMVTKPPPLPPKEPVQEQGRLIELLKKKRAELAKQEKTEARCIMTDDILDLIALCRESICMGHELVEKIKESQRQTIVNFVRAFMKKCSEKNDQSPQSTSTLVSSNTDTTQLNDTSQSLENTHNNNISQLNNSISSQIPNNSPKTPKPNKPETAFQSLPPPKHTPVTIELDSSDDSGNEVIEID